MDMEESRADRSFRQRAEHLFFFKWSTDWVCQCRGEGIKPE